MTVYGAKDDMRSRHCCRSLRSASGAKAGNGSSSAKVFSVTVDSMERVDRYSPQLTSTVPSRAGSSSRAVVDIKPECAWKEAEETPLRWATMLDVGEAVWRRSCTRKSPLELE